MRFQKMLFFARVSNIGHVRTLLDPKRVFKLKQSSMKSTAAVSISNFAEPATEKRAQQQKSGYNFSALREVYMSDTAAHRRLYVGCVSHFCPILLLNAHENVSLYDTAVKLEFVLYCFQVAVEKNFAFILV